MSRLAVAGRVITRVSPSAGAMPAGVMDHARRRALREGRTIHVYRDTEFPESFTEWVYSPRDMREQEDPAYEGCIWCGVAEVIEL